MQFVVCGTCKRWCHKWWWHLDLCAVNISGGVNLTFVPYITNGDSAGFANNLQVISHTLPIRQVHNLAQPLTFPPYSTTIAIRF